MLGGDFNAIPPGALRFDKFPDEHPSALGTDFEQPPYRLEDMQVFFDRWVAWIPLTAFGPGLAEQRRLYTHSVLGRHQIGTDGQPAFWNRTLDYLFASAGSWQDADVLQEPGRLGITSDPMLLSDHAPVTGTWLLP